jgi:hypothetical protein
MKLIIAILFSAALFWTAPQETPVNNSIPVRATARTVQAVAPEKAAEVEPSAPTEQIAEIEPETVPVEIPEPTPVPGTKEEMMAAAGIPTSDWAAVDFIVHHESTWNPSAVNPSSGSCGLVQELPCGKSGCTLGDGVCQLRWASQYATQRYGSWWLAHSFWIANNWW